MPSTSRAIDFTAVLARNGRGFFFFPGIPKLTTPAAIHPSKFEMPLPPFSRSEGPFVSPLLLGYHGCMDERDFFDEKESRKAHSLNCPHCKQSNEYELAWLVRTKRRQLPPRADDRDRAKFAKAKSYMVRRDDQVMCKNLRCRKRFEVAGVQSVAFLE